MGDETIAKEDAIALLEELIEAQNQSFVLGLKLNVPQYEVESIHAEYSSPRDRLLHVIMAFLSQERPTWRAVVDALSSTAVNMPRLADAVRRNHFTLSSDQEPQLLKQEEATVAVTDVPSQATTKPYHTTCDAGKVPTMPLLMKIELPSRVRNRVDEFGTFLLQDDKGEKMAAIRIECGEDKQKMVMEILREWLAGNGAEVSWKSLISVLMDSQLPILAEQVRTLDPENSGTQLVDSDSAIFCITDEKPTLRQLLRLNLPFRVGEDAYRLGVNLLDNYDFMDSMDNPEKCTIFIFRNWLAGKGEMVTWEVLIEALWRCKLSRLSEEVETALRDFRLLKDFS